MSWLIPTLISYFLLAIVFLVDTYLLATAALHPKVYIFYLGIFGLLIFLLLPLPFVDFFIPPLPYLLEGIGAGVAFFFGVFWLFQGLKIFEPSRIIPAIGALVPLFTFALVFSISLGKEGFSQPQFLAFFLLVGGSVLITLEKRKGVTLQSLNIAALGAFFFSLSFVMVKYVYLASSFWTGYMLMRIGGFLVALWLFFQSREVREELFHTKSSRELPFRKRPQVILIALMNQGTAALANILQNYAVFLAPTALLAFINALQGVQYVFLFLLTTLLSLWFPHIIRENISRSILFQKSIAIFLIGAGLAVLALST